MLAAVSAKWGAAALSQVVQTLDAVPDKPSIVIGTIFKEMKRKPDFMEEWSRDVLEQTAHDFDLDLKDVRPRSPRKLFVGFWRCSYGV